MRVPLHVASSEIIIVNSCNGDHFRLSLHVLTVIKTDSGVNTILKNNFYFLKSCKYLFTSALGIY